MDHSAALADPPKADFFAFISKLRSELLLEGIGRHDGFSGCNPIFLFGPQFFNSRFDAGQDVVDRQLLPYDPCRRNQDLPLFHAQLFRRGLGHLSGIDHPDLAGAGIGIAAVDYHRTDQIADVFFAKDDRRRLDHILGERSAGRTGSLAVDYRQVLLPFLDFTMDSRGFEAFGINDAILF